MASLTFPLDSAAFWDKLRIASATFALGDALQINQTRGGQVVTARLGVPLWRATVNLTASAPGRADNIAALVDLVRQSGASFHAYDPRRRLPQAGWDQGATSVTISAIASDRRELTVAGNLPGSVVTAGDHLSIVYGTRIYYGRVVQGGTFSSAGASSAVTLEVTPSLPVAVSTSDAVRLAQPYLEAVYVPGSFAAPERMPGYDAGYGFDIMQTLR